MKRSTTDVLRRGFDSTLANWQLIAIRIAENLLFVMIVIGSIMAVVVPIAVTAGMSKFDLDRAAEPMQAIAAMIVEHWLLLVYVLAIASVVLLIMVAIHSFVDAGTAKVFIDAEREAKRSATPGREAFRAFSIDRWLQGGRSSWWSIFWVYNIAWGIGGLVMLVPLLATLAGMLAISDSGGRVAIGCLGIAVSFVIIFPLAVIIAVLTQKAIAVCVARAATASAGLRQGWSEIQKDLGRHFAVAFIVFVIAIGGSTLISLLSAPLSVARGHTPFVDLAFAPAQIAVSIVQGVFSAAVGLWFLASYVGLTEER